MKKIKLKKTILIVLTIIISLTGCSTQKEYLNTVYQVSTLDALMQAQYDGIVELKDLKSQGNTGLGTFDKLAGEMIILDGVIYQAKVDGSVNIADDSNTTPFAAITNLDNQSKINEIPDINGIENLKDFLNKQITNPNLFYISRIDGFFPLIHIRSVPEQEKPYELLSKVALTQKEYVYKNIKGSLVALYCPSFVKGINLPGWHIHFISDDRTKGGHVLDSEFKNATLTINEKNEYKLVLPISESFGNIDLLKDLAKETKKVESK